MRILVISEKANAAARIATILGKGSYKRKNLHGVPVFHIERDGQEIDIVGLRGHILELDYPRELNDWRKVDPKDLVYATPEKRVIARNILAALKELSNDIDQVIIATDYDREGELIGLETVKMLSIDPKKVKRARFSALTKNEIEAAFSSLTTPDEKLAESAECRQIIDLAWGATLTRFISKATHQMGKNFLSVGRVQSPTLSLIVDRHKQIEEFVPKPYWDVTAKLRHNNAEFAGGHQKNPFWEESDAKNVLSKCKDIGLGEVIQYEANERDEYPPAPFNTTNFLAEANRLGIPASRAMSIAEDLYTSGYISYPRTDNTVYPKSLYLKGVLEKLRESEFKKEVEEILAQDRIIPSRGKIEATDHPPIYPTEVASRGTLKGEKWKIYELVVRRFLATLAPPAKVRVNNCAVSINGEIFTADGYKLINLGWRKYYPYYRISEVEIPDLSVGDKVEVLSVESIKKLTQPPPRYTQGTLIQEMERLGLGTKSTRHEIIQKLYERNYVRGNNLIPTPAGIAVAEALEKYANMITDSKMTSHLEKDMDDIARGESTIDDVVHESQDMLSDVIDIMDQHRDQIGAEIKSALEEQRHIGDCPTCGGKLRILKSREGREFIGCSGYPNCKTSFPKPKGALVEATDKKCEVCNMPMIKVIRKGQPPEVVCIDPSCTSNRKKNTIARCPKCGKEMRIVYSSNGKRFLGCSGYPGCDQTFPLPQTGTIKTAENACETCGSPMVEIETGKTTWRTCINQECSSKRANNGRGSKAKPGKQKGGTKKVSRRSSKV
ncbi:MAG: DNA topoisomerase I [Methanomassiliicoccales archaeon]|jgi:DNA topoisomerase-1